MKVNIHHLHPSWDKYPSFSSIYHTGRITREKITLFLSNAQSVILNLAGRKMKLFVNHLWKLNVLSRNTWINLQSWLFLIQHLNLVSCSQAFLNVKKKKKKGKYKIIKKKLIPNLKLHQSYLWTRSPEWNLWRARVKSRSGL